MISPIEVRLKRISIWIFECTFEVLKEWHLFGMKYNMKEGGKLLTTVDSPESVYDDISVDSFN